MSSRNAKRKRWSTIKDIVLNDLQNLSITSGDFINDVQEAIDFFAEMFKTMENRQSELFARSAGLEESYGEILNVLMDGKKAKVGESSCKKVELPLAYTGNDRRFLTDTTTSLRSHAKEFKVKMEEMLDNFQNFGDGWKQKIGDLNTQADLMVEHYAKISVILDDYGRNI